jgi:short-subunit dehydrogenase
MATRDWAVVTGASSGIGQAFSEILAEQGVNIVLAGRNGIALSKQAKQLELTHDVKTIIFAGDLTDMAMVKKLVHVVDHAKVRVTYLINNAGVGSYGPLLTTDWKIDYSLIELNIAAVTYLAKHFAFEMKQDGRGYIVNLSSMAGFLPGPNMAVYHATKAYVLHFSQALSQELAGTGVSVTALCPGPTVSGFAKTARATRTGIFGGKLPQADEIARYGYRAMTAGKRIAVPGLRNKLIIFFIRFLPRSLVTRLMGRALR